MEKINALIIEDSEFLTTVLLDMLNEYHPEVKVLATALNGKDGLNKISQLQPNLVFLDIEMPDMTGFEMLNQLETINFQTIFTTAHSHYAIKAFRFNALDYLVKPINENELKEAVHRFKPDYNISEKQHQLQNALENLQTKNVIDQKLILQTQSGILRFPLKQIIKIESERNYSNIYLTNGTKELSSKNLAYFEDILDDKGFLRCHRSFLVNKYHIETHKNDLFVLKNGSEIPISRRKKTESEYWFNNNNK